MLLLWVAGDRLSDSAFFLFPFSFKLLYIVERITLTLPWATLKALWEALSFQGSIPPSFLNHP